MSTRTRNTLRFIRPDEVKRLLAFLKKDAESGCFQGCLWRVRRWFAVELALATGLRVSEVAALRWTDFVTDKKGGWVVVRRGKFGASRMVRFGTRFATVIEEYRRMVGESEWVIEARSGKRVSVRTLQKWVKDAFKEAGIGDGYSFHSLRHTYATALYRASNYDIRLVQEQLGHRDPRSTQIYTHPDPYSASSVFNSLYES